MSNKKLSPEKLAIREECESLVDEFTTAIAKNFNKFKVLHEAEGNVLTIPALYASVGNLVMDIHSAVTHNIINADPALKREVEELSRQQKAQEQIVQQQCNCKSCQEEREEKELENQDGTSRVLRYLN